MTKGYVVTDMKDGVVEKFTYEGAEFTRKDGEASVGGYIVFTENEEAVTKDVPYEITVIDEEGDLKFIDDNSDKNYAFPQEEEFNVFTKAAQETEVQREAKVGDRIKIVAATFTGGDYANGDIGTITKEYGDGDVRADINGKDKAIIYREYVVLESAEETPETLVHEGATYQRVNRRAQAGDVVKYANGFVTRCVKTDSHGYLVAVNRKGIDRWRVYGVTSPTDVYAPVEAKGESAKAESSLTYRDSSGVIQTVIGAELIEYRAKGDE